MNFVGSNNCFLNMQTLLFQTKSLIRLESENKKRQIYSNIKA